MTTPNFRDFDEEARDIKKAVAAVKRHREETGEQNFYPSISFLQRRMLWGFIRATALREAILKELQ